jgi:hypothetical protein
MLKRAGAALALVIIVLAIYVVIPPLMLYRRIFNPKLGTECR